MGPNLTTSQCVFIYKNGGENLPTWQGLGVQRPVQAAGWLEGTGKLHRPPPSFLAPEGSSKAKRVCLVLGAPAKVTLLL